MFVPYTLTIIRMIIYFIIIEKHATQFIIHSFVYIMPKPKKKEKKTQTDMNVTSLLNPLGGALDM